MSQVARVFVVLNLLLAAGFLFAAATFLAANTDYKSQLVAEKDAHRIDNETRDGKISTLNDQVQSLSNQVSSLEEQRGTLVGSRDALTQQVSSLESEKTAKDTQIAEFQRINDGLGNGVAQLRKDLDDLRKDNARLADINKAKVDEAAAAVAAKDAAHQEIVSLKNNIAGLEKDVMAKATKIKEQGFVIDYAASKIPLDNVLVMPNISDAVVVNASDGSKYVQINKGSTQGVATGFTFSIVRGGKYIGELEIDTVSQNQSAGTMKIMAPGARVMVGDRATNVLR